MARASELYPAFLDLHGLPVLVVGGGAVALRKVKSLLPTGARITVVAKTFSAGFSRMKDVQRVRRAFKEPDLREACLVFAATDDAALNARIASLALEGAVWTNVATPPEAGNLVVPGSLRRGSLCIAVSTGGASAAAAKAVRKTLERTLDSAWGSFLKLLEARRRGILAAVPDPRRRRRLLQRLGSPDWVDKLRREGRDAVAREMDALIGHTGARGRKKGRS